MSPDEGLETIQSLVDRYLGETESSFVERLLTQSDELVRLRLHLNEMYCWDYSE